MTKTMDKMEPGALPLKFSELVGRSPCRNDFAYRRLLNRLLYAVFKITRDRMSTEELEALARKRGEGIHLEPRNRAEREALYRLHPELDWSQWADQSVRVKALDRKFKAARRPTFGSSMDSDRDEARTRMRAECGDLEIYRSRLLDTVARVATAGRAASPAASAGSRLLGAVARYARVAQETPVAGAPAVRLASLLLAERILQELGQEHVDAFVERFPGYRELLFDDEESAAARERLGARLRLAGWMQAVVLYDKHRERMRRQRLAMRPRPRRRQTKEG